MSRRLCLVLDLVDDADLIAEYEDWHAPGGVWPEVVADIRATGFLSMEIWRAGDRCVMIAEVTDDYPRSRDSAVQDKIQRWETLMWRFQKPLPFAAEGEKWVAMKRIFNLADQTAAA